MLRCWRYLVANYNIDQFSGVAKALTCAIVHHFLTGLVTHRCGLEPAKWLSSCA